MPKTITETSLEITLKLMIPRTILSLREIQATPALKQ